MKEIDSILLSYKGIIDYTTHETLVNKIKEVLISAKIPQAVQQKLIYITIEGLENVYKHSCQSEQKRNHNDSFELKKEKCGYCITIGNLVNNTGIQGLTQKLEFVNNLNLSELKKYYKDVISTGKLSEKNGAGLGIIRMAIKSEYKIEFSFEKLNTTLSYYQMKVNLLNK